MTPAPPNSKAHSFTVCPKCADARSRSCLSSSRLKFFATLKYRAARALFSHASSNRASSWNPREFSGSRSRRRVIKNKQSVEIRACLTLRVNAHTIARRRVRRRFNVGRVLVLNDPRASCALEVVAGRREVPRDPLDPPQADQARAVGRLHLQPFAVQFPRALSVARSVAPDRHCSPHLRRSFLEGSTALASGHLRRLASHDVASIICLALPFRRTTPRAPTQTTPALTMERGGRRARTAGARPANPHFSRHRCAQTASPSPPKPEAGGNCRGVLAPPLRKSRELSLRHPASSPGRRVTENEHSTEIGA